MIVAFETTREFFRGAGRGYLHELSRMTGRAILLNVKTTVDVDTGAAEKAAKLLGTTTLKDTVNAALREVLAAHRRRRLSERLRAGDLPVPTPEELARLRAPQLAPGSLRRRAR